MKRFGVIGAVTRDFITYKQRIIFHTDVDELLYLIPHVGGEPTRTRELPRDIPSSLTCHIAAHPQFTSVSWPLDKKEFKR